jgi:hypothetical protein
MIPLEDLLDMLRGKSQPEMEPVGPLSAADLAEYTSITAEMDAIEKRLHLTECRMKHLWSGIELSTGLFNTRLEIRCGILYKGGERD